MSTQPKPIDLPDRRAILDEIHALLDASNGIDETRAKQVRKALDALRSSDTPTAAGDAGGADDAVAEHGEDAPLDAEIDAGLETLRTRIHKQVERRNRDYDKALKLMTELESAIRNNELQQAERCNQKLLSITGNIPGLSEQRWRDIEKRLNRVRPKLRQLESWRHWGTTQARQELINQIKQLPDAGLPPEKLAKRIQQAREQWAAWDKSGDSAGQELWKRFDQACEEAYKPCKAHFENLKKKRAENLRQRRAVIDRLNERYVATDWKAPEWRDLDRFVRQARRDFHKIGNVDFKQRKRVAGALDQALGNFEEHLSRERARSLRVREKLIADIEALADMENLREALERLEALKNQWHVTVVGKRNLENRLWQRFQDACALTYRRRDAERKEQDAARTANLQQKQALIDELAGIVAAGDAALLANAAQLQRIRGRWEAIGRVPRQQENRLDNHWRDAQKRFRGALQAAGSRARAAELDNLARRAALCHGWEQARLDGSAPDADALRSEWASLPALTTANAAAINRRFAATFDPPDDATLASNLAEKQAACLKLEVMLELDSPPDCQDARMAYQVARLNASLKKDPDAQDSPEALLQTALVTGAVPPAAAAAIEQRIQNCLARYKNR